ncbi:hypothetical protein L484_005212 [Morus notabilis]|uniref:phytol kinase n=1 Tax=Morus notabilis TaxID=981085 RepID=W9QY77_9ROSA|nr:hypothetical protein L484_005212 [Morus notabilis]
MSHLSFTHRAILSASPILRRPSSPSPAAPLLPPRPPSYASVSFRILNPPPDSRRRSSFAPSGLPVSATGDLARDAGAAAAVLAGAYGLVFSFDSLTQRNLIQQNSTSTNARYFALLVPLVNCTRLLVHGLSLVSDEGLIKSMTRHGNPEELLRGPLYYVFALILCAFVFWRESPVGMIALSMMCGGGGYTTTIFPISLFLVPLTPLTPVNLDFRMLYYYSALGYFQLDWTSTLQRVALVSLVATVVESLPISEASIDVVKSEDGIYEEGRSISGLMVSGAEWS